MPISAYLIPLYAIATLFPRLLGLPAPLQQVQLTELLFPLLLWVYRAELLVQIRRFPNFSAAAALYLIANFTSSMWARDAGAILESLARAYLVVLALLVAAYAGRFGIRTLFSSMKWATLIVCAACVLFYGLIVSGLVGNGLALLAYFPQYPYFGEVYRLRGPATVYGMMYMLLLPGLLIGYADWRWRGGALWVVAIIALAGLLTLGKENVLFPIGVLLLEALRIRSTRRRLLLRGAAAGLAVFLLLATHFLVVRNDSPLLNTAFISGGPALTLGDFTVVGTNYSANKRAAWHIGVGHPAIGVGPGLFSQYTETLVAEGKYPSNFGRFDPHSAWTGAFAETGLFGLLGLLLLVIALWHLPPGDRSGVAAVLLLLFLLASIFKDVMNFRGLWVLVGVYLCGPHENTFNALAHHKVPYPTIPEDGLPET